MDKLIFTCIVLFINMNLCLSQIHTKFEMMASATPNIFPTVPFPEDPALFSMEKIESSNFRAYGGRRNGKNGIVIKIDIDAHYLKGENIDVVSWFSFWNYYSNSVEKKLNDYNNSYRATDGQVSTSGQYTSHYKHSQLKDFELFIPFKELHLGKGNHTICFDIGMFSNNQQLHVTNYMIGTLTIN